MCAQRRRSLKQPLTQSLKPWTYNDEIVDTVPEGMYGFVYQITDPASNVSYIGKKFFWSRKTIQRNKKKKRIVVESDWKNYIGSSERFKNYTKEFIHELDRKILFLCTSKTECAYLETKTILNSNALLSDEYFNDWVSCKIRRAHLNSISDHEQLYSKV